MSSLTRDDFESIGLVVRGLSLDSRDIYWHNWKKFYEGEYPNSPHKIFEHYATERMAEVEPEDVLLDVAADKSPYTDCTNSLNTIIQDLSYPPGKTGRVIGSLASDIPLDDHSVDVITLHCSFEHFEGNEDKGFLREAERLLAPMGICVIAPFYTWDTYTETPPQPSPNTGFGRFYDLRAIQERILPNTGSLDVSITQVYFDHVFQFDALVLRS